MSKSRIVGGAYRIASFLLVISLLLSLSAVFITGNSTAYAADGEDEESPFSLIYNRTYDEGWGLDNGMSLGGIAESIDKEQTMQYTNNYFWRVSLVQSGATYSELGFDGRDEIGSVIEFDIKSDDYCNIGRVMYLRTKGGAAAGTVANLFYIKNNNATFFSEDGYSFSLTNEWVTVSFVFDYTPESPTAVAVYAYLDGMQVAELTFNVKADQSKGIDWVRVGNPGSNLEEDFGDSFCLDNVKMYSGVNAVTEITPEMGYGTAVDPGAAKTEKIEGQTDPVLETLDGSLAMKIGVNYCYSKGERLPILTNEETGVIYGAPQKIDGKVMIPFDAIIMHTGYPAYYHPDGTMVSVSEGECTSYIPIGGTSAVLGDKRVTLSVAPGYATGTDGNKFLVIAAEDVEKVFDGWYITYDDMGLAILSQVKDVVNRDEHLINMTGIMKKFVFDYPSAEEIYEDVKEFTNNFDHPYMLTNQEELDNLRAIYEAEPGDENYNEIIYETIQEIIDYTDIYYRYYALPHEEYGYRVYGGFNTVNAPVMPYEDTFGYDPDGGRLAEVEDPMGELFNFAAAYQFTLDERYARVAYDLALSLDKWDHWGHEHILNTADAASEFAIYYDWCYDINLKLFGQEGVDKLATMLFEKAVERAWYSTTTGSACYDGSKRKQGDSSNYIDRTNNWNAVCTSGFTMGALCILDVVEPGKEIYEEINKKGTELISKNLYYVVNVGMEPYAPDGAYAEGTAYWGYATNVYFKLCMALDNAAGENYGLTDCWGMDTTSYFACHTESSDFICYNYNDSNDAAQSTNFFYYCANAYNDPTLAAIRSIQISNGKNCTLYDILEYPTEALGSVELPLDYVAGGMDLFTARSDWEKGALFVGIMGGDNNMSHGDVDAGSFVYHNEGTVWFRDFGSDNYNVPGYWNNATRYRYYTKKAEGHNTLAISSASRIPFGQVLSSTAPIINYDSNEHGSMVVYDMTATMEGAAMSWQRGLLLTNDRKTVIIQDEVALSDMHSIYWFGHFMNTEIEVDISDDGRTAYMSNKKNGIMLRASIVAALSRFKFELMDCYTYIHTSSLDGTYPKEYAINAGTPEEDRSGYSKLCIRAENTLSFNVAVVLEIISDTSDPVQYEWTDMRLWEPGVYTGSGNGSSVGSTKEEAKTRTAPNKNTIRSSVGKAELYYSEGEAYTTRISEFYRALTDLKYDMGYYDNRSDDELANDSLYIQGIDTLDIYGAEYDEFVEKINQTVATKNGIASLLVGYEHVSAESRD